MSEMMQYFKQPNHDFTPDFSVPASSCKADLLYLSAATCKPAKLFNNESRMLEASNLHEMAMPEIKAETIRPTKVGFMDLPLEIRLQIYSHLVTLHKAEHSHLSPSHSYPGPTSSEFFLTVISRSLVVEFPDFDAPGKSVPEVIPTMRGGQGCGRIPSTLLQSCKQVYHEARLVPFQENEFVFINWFCSGVYAARAFLRGLAPWQREQMRFARIEVLGRDLRDSWVLTMTGGTAGGGEWVDLCRLWSGGEHGQGLWGLRLGIKGKVENKTQASQTEEFWREVIATGSALQFMGEVDPEVAAWDPGDREVAPKDRNVMDTEAEWVVSGLAQMRGLRWLELEIEDEEVQRDQKVQFCLDLAAKLSGAGRRVDVAYVERLVEEPKALVTASEPSGSDEGSTTSTTNI